MEYDRQALLIGGRVDRSRFHRRLTKNCHFASSQKTGETIKRRHQGFVKSTVLQIESSVLSSVE